MRQKVKKTGLLIAVVLLVLAAGFGSYVSDYYHADAAAAAAMEGSQGVTVRLLEDMVVFTPEKASAGLIFYPGGKVEFTAYAPLMRSLAERNILCVIVEMPFHLAVLDVNAAEGIPEQFPEVEHWYIGGHSLGGSMAASCAAQTEEAFQGLVLLAAYSTADLTGTDLAVLSLYGTKDGVLNMEKYADYRPNLPDSTTETILEGGNHAQFGSYGPQEGDGAAELSAAQQTALTAEAITAFIMGREMRPQ